MAAIVYPGVQTWKRPTILVHLGTCRSLKNGVFGVRSGQLYMRQPLERIMLIIYITHSYAALNYSDTSNNLFFLNMNNETVVADYLIKNRKQ